MSIFKLARLLFGILLYALGIVLSLNANLGLSPWNVFSQGLSFKIGITIGQATILTGLSVLIIDYILKEKIGIGTLINIFGIGLTTDFLLYLSLIPQANNIVTGLVYIILSLFIIAIASYFYIGAGFGTGPRDGLMIGLVKKTNKPVGLIRSIIEISVLILGYFLGGTIGIGTLVLATLIGPIVQFIFSIFSFDVKKVNHTYIWGNKKNVKHYDLS